MTNTNSKNLDYCTRCRLSKPLDSFSQKKSGGFYSYCKDCSSESSRAYYKANRIKEIARALDYDSKHRKEKRESFKKWSWSLKIETLNKYGGECVCCGESEPKFLAIDHKENDGNKHRKEIGNLRIYSWLKKNNYPSTFQILCHNCNMAKGLWGKCPHKLNGVRYKKID